MSEIVLGIATSHSPLLTFGPELWLERAKDDRNNRRLTLSDGRTITYDELSAITGDKYTAQSTFEHMSRQSAAAQRHLDRLADEIEAAAPDVVIITGDDQEELFVASNTPAISVYYGDEMVMYPLTQLRPDLPEWRAIAAKAYRLDAPYRFRAAPDFAREIIDHCMNAGVDLGVSSSVPEAGCAGFGHAFGFIVERLFRKREIPVLPILLNTYFPPNVMRASRCYEVGRILRSAIEQAPSKLRIAIVASGGLSHFVTDEALDRAVLDAITTGNADVLRGLTPDSMRSGSSEILNWVLAAGALEGLPVAWTDYLPVYRTPAGSGIGLGFACWR